MANTEAWWQPSVFKKYFLKTVGNKKQEKGAQVVVVVTRQKSRNLFFFPCWTPLPEEQQSVTAETPAEMQHTTQNLMMMMHHCSIWPPLKAHISIFSEIVYLALHLHHNEICLQCSCREKKQTTGLTEVCDYQTACERLSTAKNTIRTCLTTNICAMLHFYLRHNAGQAHLEYPNVLSCLLQPPVWLRAAGVSALTYWREPEESCRAAEANDELHCEW